MGNKKEKEWKEGFSLAMKGRKGSSWHFILGLLLKCLITRNFLAEKESPASTLLLLALYHIILLVKSSLIVAQLFLVRSIWAVFSQFLWNTADCSPLQENSTGKETDVLGSSCSADSDLSRYLPEAEVKLETYLRWKSLSQHKLLHTYQLWSLLFPG